jgi:regulator of sigma E protease
MEVSQVIVTIGYICRFLIVLSVLVFVHELGHFWAAVRAGIRVEVFSLGFGKKLFRFNRKGTEYAISSIPLGGYVKLAGDTREESKGGGDEFLGKPVGKRFNVIAAGRS